MRVTFWKFIKMLGDLTFDEISTIREYYFNYNYSLKINLNQSTRTNKPIVTFIDKPNIRSKIPKRVTLQSLLDNNPDSKRLGWRSSGGSHWKYVSWFSVGPPVS